MPRPLRPPPLINLQYNSLLKAKLHYAIWSQTGSKLVVDLLQTC